MIERNCVGGNVETRQGDQRQHRSQHTLDSKHPTPHRAPTALGVPSIPHTAWFQVWFNWRPAKQALTQRHKLFTCAIWHGPTEPEVVLYSTESQSRASNVAARVYGNMPQQRSKVSAGRWPGKTGGQYVGPDVRYLNIIPEKAGVACRKVVSASSIHVQIHSCLGLRPQGGA